MNENLFTIVITILPALIALIAGYSIPLLKAKLGTERLSAIFTWITYAVKCAEMIFLGEKQGEEKKRYVIKFITNMFNKKKVVITDEQLNVLIEAAVKELKAANNK